MKYYIIKMDESHEYYLSERYEKAAENVLGYGGVWTPNKSEARKFETKRQAQTECRIIAKFTHRYDTIIVEVEA